MAFDPVVRLANGDIEFIYRMTSSDKEMIIKRIKTSPNRVNIIRGFFDKLKDDMAFFCYDIIYDIPEFNEEALKLFQDVIGVKHLTVDKLPNILNNMAYGKILLTDYLDELLEKGDDFIECISKYLIVNRLTLPDVLKVVSKNSNLHIRYVFMKVLISQYPEAISSIYDSLDRYFTTYNYLEGEQLTIFLDLMDVKEICILAIEAFKNNQLEIYQIIKAYILATYKYNTLAYELSELKSLSAACELQQEIDTFFATSINYKMGLLRCYKNLISQDMIDSFFEKLKYFAISDERWHKKDECNFNRDYDDNLYRIYACGLGPMLEEYITKYLDISTRKDYEYLASGTTTSSYRIGDYVFKLSKTKWSYEDVICPDLYLIAKNYEERFIRDSRGIVIAGLEIQQYLKRDVSNVPLEYFDLFIAEMARLGYRVNDTLRNGKCGDNTRLLNTYKDADCYNPEKLPDWFKDVPLVLVDRDRVYPKDATRIRQLVERGY